MVLQSCSTVRVLVEGTSSQTRLSPLVVKYTEPPAAKIPSPPLKAVVEAWRSGPPVDVGIQLTVVPDTDAA